MKKVFLVALVFLFSIGTANALTLAWDAYTDSNAMGIRIESSSDKLSWTTLVNNIPVNAVASEIPDGPDNGRIYYRLKAFNETEESDPSNVVSYYWTTGGGGYEGLMPVDGIRLLDCEAILANDPEDELCKNRHIP